MDSPHQSSFSDTLHMNKKMIRTDRRMGGEHEGKGRGVALLVTIQGIDCGL